MGIKHKERKYEPAIIAAFLTPQTRVVKLAEEEEEKKSTKSVPSKCLCGLS